MTLHENGVVALKTLISCEAAQSHLLSQICHTKKTEFGRDAIRSFMPPPPATSAALACAVVLAVEAMLAARRDHPAWKQTGYQHEGIVRDCRFRCPQLFAQAEPQVFSVFAEMRLTSYRSASLHGGDPPTASLVAGIHTVKNNSRRASTPPPTHPPTWN